MSLPRLDFRTVDVSLPAQNPADLAAEIERLLEDAVVYRSVETSLTVEAERLRAEIERLQHDLADLREAQAQHRMDNEHAYDEGYDAGTRRGYESECAAVVAWLRAHANAPHPIERGVPSLSPAGRGLLLLHADRIERGEHRREEEP